MEGRDDVRAPAPVGLLLLLPLWWWVRRQRLSRLAGAPMSDVRPALARGTAVDRAVAGVPPIAVSGRLDRRRRRAASRIGARRAAQRRNLDHPGYGYLQQHAGGGLLTANRLDVARRTATEFVRARTPSPTASGLVAFAGQALTQVPNHHRLRSIEKPSASCAWVSSKTGRQSARHRHQREPPAPDSRQEQGRRVAHDGENNKGTVDPRTAAQAAATFASRSTRSESGLRARPSPDRQGPLGSATRTMPVKIDEQLLSEVARTTGGRYFARRTPPRCRTSCGDQSAGEDAAAASRLPSLRRGVSRAAGDRVAGVGARAGPGGHIRGARAMITFDAPVVITLAPVVAGAVWAASAWARRARVRRAAAWSESTARIVARGGEARAPALGLRGRACGGRALGPRWGEERIVTETRGLKPRHRHRHLALDAAEDAKPSRLGRALREARRLVQDLDGDRLGLAAFAARATSCPRVGGMARRLRCIWMPSIRTSRRKAALRWPPALAQGIDLLHASPEIRRSRARGVPDGEAHDSLEQVAAGGAAPGGARHSSILVAEGGRQPTKIPVRDDRGTLSRGSRMDQGIPSSQQARRCARAVERSAMGELRQAGARGRCSWLYKRATRA